MRLGENILDIPLIAKGIVEGVLVSTKVYIATLACLAFLSSQSRVQFFGQESFGLYIVLGLFEAFFQLSSRH